MTPRNLNFSRYALAAAVGTIAGVERAAADFTSPYALNPPANGNYSGANASGAFGNWTSSLTFVPSFGSDALITNAPFSVEFNINNLNNPTITDTWDLTITAPASGLVAFDWNFNRSGVPIMTFGYTVNGSYTQLASVSSLGTSSFAVVAGDTFGFRLVATYQATGGVIISNFSAPVPEPSVGLLAAMGAVGLLGLRAVRRRRARK